MRVLLVNPNREHSPEPVAPLGLCQIASASAAAGHETEVLDLCFRPRPEARLRRSLRRRRPDVVGFSVRNLDNADARAPRFYLDALCGLANVVRDETGRPPILGGAGLTTDPERVMAHLGAELAVVGAGEEGFPELLGWLEGGEAGPPPASLARRTADGYLRARVRPGTLSVPFASAQLQRWLNPRPYLRRGGAWPIQTRRGCPMHCVYCNYPAIEGNGMILRDPDDVVRDVAGAVANGAQQVEFADGVFNRPRVHALAISDAIHRSGLKVQLRSSVTPAGLDSEVAGSMRRAGFASLLCSPDAAHPDTIRSYQKGFTRAELENAVVALADVDLPTMFCFILGGPGETDETLEETLRFARDHCGPPHAALLATRMRVYPSTPLSAVAGTAPLRPEPEAFYLAEGLDPVRVDERAAESARACPHILYMDSGRGARAGVSRRVLAAFGSAIPAFTVPARLRGRYAQGQGRSRR